MHVVVFGATGPSGPAVIEAALEARHHVRAFALPGSRLRLLGVASAFDQASARGDQLEGTMLIQSSIVYSLN